MPESKIRFAELRENRRRLFFVALLCSFFHVLWGVWMHMFCADANDPMGLRVVVTVICLSIMLFYILRDQERKDHDIILMLAATAFTLHNHYLAYLNPEHFPHLLGAMLVGWGTFSILESWRTAVIYAFIFGFGGALLSVTDHREGHGFFLGLTVLITVLMGLMASYNKHQALNKFVTEAYKSQVLISSMREGLALHDPEGKIIVTNQAAQQILGLTEDELLNSSDLAKHWILKDGKGARLNTEDIPSVRARLAGVPVLDFHLKSQYQDRAEKDLVVNAVPLKLNEGSEGLHVLATFQDITEEIKIEEKIKEQQASLFHASKLSALGEMASGIAHEINNPLAVIRGKADVCLRILEGKIDSNQQAQIVEHLEKINLTVDRINRIVRSLRTLSRQAPDDALSDFEVQPVIEEVMDLCRMKVHSLGVRMTWSCLPDLRAHGRATHTGQILLNLISNAVDAIENSADQGISISASPSEDGTQVIIQVVDSGPGVPSHLVHKVMEPFFTTKEAGRGTGLGLSLSRKMALDQGGDLRYLEGAERSTFQLTLPRGLQRVL